MKDASPSLPVWRDLYDAAIAFKKIEPWKWMSDVDVFGVQNPASGEIGYCSIMGALGEVFALAVYRGMRGLQVLLDMADGEIAPTDDDALLRQDCLMASFENREELEKQDIAVIKKLGLKFRGRGAWPMFRDYSPGYFPWFLEDDQARCLTLALQQAAGVCQRCKQDADLIHAREQDRYLVRVAAKEGEALTWRDEWLKPAPPDSRGLEPGPMDERRAQGIERAHYPVRGTWEFSFFHVPTAVHDERRPYYPVAVLAADHESGLVLNMGLVHPSRLKEEIPQRFFGVIEKLKCLPAEVLICQDVCFRLVDRICRRLGVHLTQADKLEATDEVREGLSEYMCEDL